MIIIHVLNDKECGRLEQRLNRHESDICRAGLLLEAEVIILSDESSIHEVRSP
jgi:hypothetical protein